MEYEVEKILKHKKVNKRSKTDYEYLVHWKGYPPEEDSWIPREDMACDDLIFEYWSGMGRNIPHKTTFGKVIKKKFRDANGTHHKQRSQRKGKQASTPRDAEVPDDDEGPATSKHNDSVVDRMPGEKTMTTIPTEELPEETQQLIHVFEELIKDTINKIPKNIPRLKETHDDLVPRRTSALLAPKYCSISNRNVKVGAQTNLPSVCRLPDNQLAQRLRELMVKITNARQSGTLIQLPPELEQKYFEKALEPKKILHFVHDNLPNRKIYGLVRFHGEVDDQYIELDCLKTTMPELMLNYIREPNE